jgi:hypothetical protein
MCYNGVYTQGVAITAENGTEDRTMGVKRTGRPGTRQLEARALGANLSAIRRAGLWRGSAAPDIRAVWDYRAAGLSVDDAREHIRRWMSLPYRYEEPQALNGRYRDLLRQVQALRSLYRRDIIDRQPVDAPVLPAANGAEHWWRAGDRVLVTRRDDDVTWSDNPRHRYPASRRVQYRTYLLPEDYATMPSVRRLLRWRETTNVMYYLRLPASLVAEQYVDHDGRGNWPQRVLDALLPGARYEPPSTIR